MLEAYPLVTPLSEVTTPAQQGSIERARSRSSVGEVAEYSQQNMQTLASGEYHRSMAFSRADL
jgi:hypothetical protein